MQAVEIRPYHLLASQYPFPVNDAGLNLQGQEGFDYPGILAGPVVASARVEPDTIPNPPRDQAVAIVLDFVNPLSPFRSLLGRCW